MTSLEEASQERRQNSDHFICLKQDPLLWLCQSWSAVASSHEKSVMWFPKG